MYSQHQLSKKMTLLDKFGESQVCPVIKLVQHAGPTVFQGFKVQTKSPQYHFAVQILPHRNQADLLNRPR